MMTARDGERWHVGKEIPVALLMSLLMSVASGVWYASATNTRINALEETFRATSSTREDIVQIREQLRNLDRVTQRLEAFLDRRADTDGEVRKTDRGTLQ